MISTWLSHHKSRNASSASASADEHHNHGILESEEKKGPNNSHIVESDNKSSSLVDQTSTKVNTGPKKSHYGKPKSTQKYFGAHRLLQISWSDSGSKKPHKAMNILGVQRSPIEVPKSVLKRNSAKYTDSASTSSTTRSKASSDSINEDLEKMTINSPPAGILISCHSEDRLNSYSSYGRDSPTPHKVHFFTSHSGSDDSDDDDKHRTNSSYKGDKKSGRFQKILRPLRRSHSAGCTKDVPAHALFLRHEIIEKRKPVHIREQCEPTTVEKGNSPNSSDIEDERGSCRKHDTKKKRNLGKEMKNKLRFLRRRHTDTTLGMKAAKMKDGQPGKPTAKEAQEWSKSLEHLLNDRNGVQLFRSFLRTEFSDENLEFWIACEDYKNVSKGPKQGGRAREIYNDYVAIQAPHEINLDSDTRAAVAKLMDNPNKHTFENAQKRIQALMEKDSYPRFLKSDVYLSITGGDT